MLSFLLLACRLDCSKTTMYYMNHITPQESTSTVKIIITMNINELQMNDDHLISHSDVFNEQFHHKKKVLQNPPHVFKFSFRVHLSYTTMVYKNRKITKINMHFINNQWLQFKEKIMSKSDLKYCGKSRKITKSTMTRYSLSWWHLVTAHLCSL